MKDKFKKIINKNLKMLVVILIIIAMAMGMLLMLISGNSQDRDQVPIDPTAEQVDKEQERKERKLAQSSDHPGVSDVAINMYNARVDDMSDTAQVAQLVEATDMRDELGGYLVTVKNNDTLIISFERELKAGEDAAFDEKATWYAEQLLCLIKEADEIRWTYKMEKTSDEIAKEKAKLKAEAEKAAKEKAEKEKSEKDSDEKDSDKKEEKTEVEITVDKFKTIKKSLTTEQADELLGTEVKGYSETPELVQTLLNNQKGIV